MTKMSLSRSSAEGLLRGLPISIEEKGKKLQCNFMSFTNHLYLDSQLDIKYILNYWDSIQDGPLTVGDCFDNPSSSGDISNSVVKVARFRPTARELEDPQRFESIIRESTARPQKRLYEHLTKLCARNSSSKAGCEAGDGVDWDSGQLIDSHTVSNKRRKVHGHRGDDCKLSDRSTSLYHGVEDEDHSHLQSIPRYLSPSVQIIDSQGSHARKRM